MFEQILEQNNYLNAPLTSKTSEKNIISQIQGVKFFNEIKEIFEEQLETFSDEKGNIDIVELLTLAGVISPGAKSSEDYIIKSHEFVHKNFN